MSKCNLASEAQTLAGLLAGRGQLARGVVNFCTLGFDTLDKRLRSFTAGINVWSDSSDRSGAAALGARRCANHAGAVAYRTVDRIGHVGLQQEINAHKVNPAPTGTQWERKNRPQTIRPVVYLPSRLDGDRLRLTFARMNPVPANASAINTAARALAEGKLVAFPTETVYGLGADATSDLAVASVFAAKSRPNFNPLIAHVSGLEGAAREAIVTGLAEQLAARFWPGPLTLVLKRRGDAQVSLLAGAGLDTLALRAPDHSVAQALLRVFGRPIVAPSANRSGRLSPTAAAHVTDELGEKVGLILDGGPTPLGLESTVVDLSSDEPALVRPGALPREAIVAITGPLRAASSRIVAPGMLASHYAPERQLRLSAVAPRPGEALLAFGSHVPDGASYTLNLSPRGDLIEAAANLFAYLRVLDTQSVHTIAVMPIPETGLGEAINDRLRRAAAPRPQQA